MYEIENLTDGPKENHSTKSNIILLTISLNISYIKRKEISEVFRCEARLDEPTFLRN